MKRIEWRAEGQDKTLSLRYGKGSGNPVNAPYLLFLRNPDDRPAGRMWLTRNDLVRLHAALSSELRISPTHIMSGGSANGSQPEGIGSGQRSGAFPADDPRAS